jgi:hypothetical protein
MTAERSFTLATLQRTYTGLLDDAMLRYTNDYVGEKFFNKMILKNIVFGGGIYMNDGYLVNHPISRAYLHDDNSLLRVMLATNFIKVLTREQTPEALALMPKKMADSGSRSFVELVNRKDWPDFFPLYERLCQGFFYNSTQRSWPLFDMSYGYDKLIRRVLGASPDEVGLTLITEDQMRFIHDAYLESDPRSGNPRDKFERAVLKVLKGKAKDFRASRRQLMDLGNQAYHYNFGLTLTEEEPNGVSVDTTMGFGFDEFLETTEIDRGQLASIPLIQVPDNLPFEHGDLFRPFLDPTTRVGTAKIAYLAKLRDLLSPQAKRINELRKDVQEATQQYMSEIEAIFGVDLEFHTDASVTLARGYVHRGAARKKETVATAAPVGGLAIQLQARAMAEKRQFLVRRFRLRDVTAEFDLDRESTIHLDDIRPQIASLAFNPGVASDHVKDLPRFRK